MYRLFVGLSLPEDVRDALSSLWAGLPGAKWVDPDNLHVTLRFIGEVSRADAEDIDGTLARIDAPAFQLSLAGVDCFQTGRRVRAVWVGVAGEPLLNHLQDKVESAVVRAGHPPERRKFKPHVTLARFKNGTSDRIGDFVAAHAGFTAAPFQVERFTLFRSRLGAAGPHYEPLNDYDLTVFG